MQKKYRVTKKILRNFVLALIVIIVAIILFSPYGKKQKFSHKLTIYTIEINASVDSVYSFLGKSSNASKWSVFVDHITPLNSEDVPDGQVGSKRRCFQNENEQGIWWDEEITEVEKNKKRQLRIYNTNNFPYTADSLSTEQIYQTLDNDKCKLSFTLFFNISDPDLFDKFKMYLGSYKVKRIFKKNMENIKRIIETGK